MNKRSTLQQGLKFLICSHRLPLLGVLALVCLLAMSSQPASAQAVFGSVVGNVTDASNAAVQGANVKITLISTNDSRTVQTNDTGGYTISAVTPGTYRVEVGKAGFRSFAAPNILVNQNNIVRVDAQLQVGAVTETVEVTATTAVLQTDRATITAEVTVQHMMELPQPNRTFLGLMEMVPGTDMPAGQLSGGTNNPSKGMTFAFNGTGTNSNTIRIEGVNAANFWNTSAQSYVPSIEAIENVNVSTNASDAEQAMAGGASVSVRLKSGSNDTHGALFWYNSNSAFEARNFFAPSSAGPKPPPLNNNNAGGNMGGRIIKDKLFYFGSYEGDFAHTADSALLSIPNRAQLSGDMSGSTNPIYDPLTGTEDGRNRTPFPNSFIPSARIDGVTKRIIPDIPATNTGGSAVINNYYMNRKTIYNLHKLDTKFDYNVTSKLRLFARYGKQPYYNFQQPIYGEVLGGNAGFPQSGAGNYLQHGHGVTVSGSGTYVASATMVIDATWGFVKSHQLLFPNKFDEKYGADVLKIPGANQGPLPWSGGVPNFQVDNFVTMGMSYPALEYFQPLYEYTGNVSKIKGSHTIRAGADLMSMKPKHIELRENRYIFNGASTILNGGPGANPYNTLSDFLLGRFNSAYQWKQILQPYLLMATKNFAMYARDQWQVNRKLTLNYGVRWEKYPVPNRETTGIYFWDIPNNIVQVCGEGGTPRDCGIKVSNKIFAPSFGIAYRPSQTFVIRAGYSLNPFQDSMGRNQMQAFPGEVRLDLNPVNASYGAGGTLTTGFPIIPDPTGVNGSYVIPPNTGNITAINSNKNYVRGYFQTYNLSIQKEFAWGILGQVGYAGMHSVHLQRVLNINYGTLGGGNASLPLAKFGQLSTTLTTPHFDGTSKYNSLQATLTKRLSHGLSLNGAYTYSKQIAMAASIRIPEYNARNYYTAGTDRTHHLILSGSYALPFGKGKKYGQQSAAAAILGGWSANGIFNRWSGAPFTVSASAASCNCPGNSQTADLIKQNVAIVGRGVGGGATSANLDNAYFDPLAYRPVTGARFGTGGFNQLRGPGISNLDMSVFRVFPLTERFKIQFRVEALNLSNSPHLANPSGQNVSNMTLNSDGTLRSLGGFSQITAAAPVGRVLDQRYFRFGLRLNW